MAAVKEKIRDTLLERFDGGLNARDDYSQLQPNETPNCLNVTLDQRGGAVKRLGHSKVNGSAMVGNAKDGFYWESQQLAVLQIGASLYKTSDFVTITLFQTLSTSALVGLCEFNGELVIAHPVDGVYTYTGAGAPTSRSATAKGSICLAWQNKVWVTADPGNRSRVWWSNLGDSHTWTTGTDFVDLRDKDDSIVVAAGLGQGMDIAGRPGLCVFKDSSAYRINNSTTGAYTTIDNRHGCAGPLAVTSLFGKIAVVNKFGLFTTDGTTELVPVSPKLQPLFRAGYLNLSALSGACAGVGQDRMFFSIPIAGSTTNNLELEYHPLQGWIVPHDYAAGFYMNWEKNDFQLYKGHPSTAYVYKAFSGGSDDGAAISCRFQTSWVIPYGGYRATFHRCRVKGRGTNVAAYTLLDFTAGQGELQDYTIDLGGFTWNSFTWNDGSMWGPSTYEDYADLWRLGVGKAVSLMFKESSTSTTNAPKLLDQGTAPAQGPFAIYELLFEHDQRGRS
jgi:hypothetical protein